MQALLFAVIAGGIWLFWNDWEQPAAMFILLLVALPLAALLYYQQQHFLSEIERLTSESECLRQTNERLSEADQQARNQMLEMMKTNEAVYIQNWVLGTLHQTASSLMSRLEWNDTLTAILKRAAELVGTKHGFIMILDDSGGYFERQVAMGIFEQDLDRRHELDTGLVGEVYRSGKAVAVADYSTWERRNNHPFFDNLHAVLQIPLLSEGRIMGIIGLAFTEPYRMFLEKDFDLLSRSADLAAIALDNAKLYRNLKQSEEKLRAIRDGLPDSLWVVDGEGRVVDFKPEQASACLSFSAVTPGMTVQQLFPIAIASRLIAFIKLALESERLQVYEYSLSEGGSTYYFEARFTALSQDQRVLIIIRDITRRKELELQLEYLSLRDALTGLYNRTFFEEEMQRISKSRIPYLGIILCDVNDLKFINDTLGHQAGDTVLRVMADILRSVLRPDDVVARIGGDEFAVVLPHADELILAQLKKRIQQAINDYAATEPTAPLSIASGYASNSGRTVSATDLFREADNNMYREKLHCKPHTRKLIVQAVLQVLKNRDFMEDGHGDRLEQMIIDLARRCGVEEQELPKLQLFAQFHDVGKVGIADSILFKPAVYSDEERLIIQTHSEIGYRIARLSPELEEIADWIFMHHEWWNGQGYPTGAKGEEIPQACRLLAVVDAFDAMTHDRAYRAIVTEAEALAEIRHCAGVQFDPVVASAFVEMMSANDSKATERCS